MAIEKRGSTALGKISPAIKRMDTKIQHARETLIAKVERAQSDYVEAVGRAHAALAHVNGNGATADTAPPAAAPITEPSTDRTT